METEVEVKMARPLGRRRGEIPTREWDFLWQGTHPPFGYYPCTSSPDLAGTHVITYPVGYTKLLRYPYTVEECKVLGIAYVPLSAEDQSERTLIKRKVIAQLGHGVYNV